MNNYIGVKYHVYYDCPADLISLHNFNDGYCGISHVEDNQCCLCYSQRPETCSEWELHWPIEKLILAKTLPP
jgi:hypothetical protein